MFQPLEQDERVPGFSSVNRLIKRLFDVALAMSLFALLFWLVGILILIARVDTRASGLFRQQRIGLWGEPFTILKIRTMRQNATINTNVTIADDPRITSIGRFIRRTKLDELPQLVNVILGDMSFVGPRPDVPEMYDGLSKGDRRILTISPGITGPASIAFRREEEELAKVDDPEKYNRDIVYPAKIRINLEYLGKQSFFGDLKIMIRTIF